MKIQKRTENQKDLQRLKNFRLLDDDFLTKWLDILATDDTGAKMNVEIQRSDKGTGKKERDTTAA